MAQDKSKEWYSDFAAPVVLEIATLQKLAGQAGSVMLRQCRYLRQVHTRLATESDPTQTAKFLRDTAIRECPGCPLKKTQKCESCSHYYTETATRCSWHPDAKLVPLTQPFKWCIELHTKDVSHQMGTYQDSLPLGYRMSPRYLKEKLVDLHVPEINIVEEEARLITLQHRRIQARASDEIKMPFMIEQVGREIERKMRMLAQHAETKIKLGLIEGTVSPRVDVMNVQHISHHLEQTVNVSGEEPQHMTLLEAAKKDPNRIGRMLAAARILQEELSAPVKRKEVVDVRGTEVPTVEPFAGPVADPGPAADDGDGSGDGPAVR